MTVKETRDEAENFVKQSHRDKYNIDLIKKNDGSDFQNQDATYFVEVKGSGKETLTKKGFVDLQKSQYQEAKKCIEKNLHWELDIVLGVGTKEKKLYRIPAREVIENARINWQFDLLAEYEKYRDEMY